MKLSVVCALLLFGCAVGCLSDPYYIDDGVHLGQSSSGAAIEVPSNVPSSSDTAPEASVPDDMAPPDAALFGTSAETDVDSGTEAAGDPTTQDDPTTVVDAAVVDDTTVADDATTVDDTTEATDNTTEADAAVDENGEVPSTGALVQGSCWPMCNLAEEDGVLDGWGTQYDRSCVRQGTEAPACTYSDETAGFSVEGDCYRPCPGPTLDEAGDGWAEHDGQTCVVTGTELAMSAERCPYP